MIVFLFLMFVLFSRSIEAYDLVWDAKTATATDGKRVVRIQMSAGASPYRHTFPAESA